MSKVVILGGSGGLAELLIKDFIDMGCFVDSITRNSSKSSNNLVSLNSNFPEKFCNKKVDSHYSDFIFEKDYDILILPQSIFDPNELINKKNEEIDKAIENWSKICKLITQAEDQSSNFEDSLKELYSIN